MADPKEEKPSKGTGDDGFNVMIFAIVGLYLLWVIIQRINLYLVERGAGSYGDIWETLVNVFFKNVWPEVKVIGLAICVVTTWSMVKILRQFTALRKEENILYRTEITDGDIKEEDPTAGNPHWTQVQLHINSKNPGEWKLAIIEADGMLDQLLKSIGYHGETVGDRLKAVEKSDFLSLEAAWEAHKIRNQIAHEGPGFEINEREARRIVGLYEIVFREFKII